MSEDPVEYIATPTILNTKYRSNPNYEAVRQGVISVLNTFDPVDSVVDNYERVKSEAVKAIECVIEDAKLQLIELRKNGLSMSVIAQENYLKGCYDCLERIELYL